MYIGGGLVICLDDINGQAVKNIDEFDGFHCGYGVSDLNLRMLLKFYRKK